MKYRSKVYLVLFFIFVLKSHGFSQSIESPSGSIRIYLCSRLTQEARDWNDVVTQELTNGFALFRPQDQTPNIMLGLPQERDLLAYNADMEGMIGADMLLVLPPYGRDCAWEIGWFGGKGKPAVAYAEAPGDWTRDAMVKGGLTALITDNSDFYNQLLSDPSVSNKSYLIDSRDQLGEAIKNIYYQNSN